MQRIQQHILVVILSGTLTVGCTNNTTLNSTSADHAATTTGTTTEYSAGGQISADGLRQLTWGSLAVNYTHLSEGKYQFNFANRTQTCPTPELDSNYVRDYGSAINFRLFLDSSSNTTLQRSNLACENGIFTVKVSALNHAGELENVEFRYTISLAL